MAVENFSPKKLVDDSESRVYKHYIVIPSENDPYEFSAIHRLSGWLYSTKGDLNLRFTQTESRLIEIFTDCLGSVTPGRLISNELWPEIDSTYGLHRLHAIVNRIRRKLNKVNPEDLPFNLISMGNGRGKSGYGISTTVN